MGGSYNFIYLLLYLIVYFLVGYFLHYRFLLLLCGFIFISLLTYNLKIRRDQFIFLLFCHMLHYFWWINWGANIPPLFFFYSIFFSIGVSLKNNRFYFYLFWICMFIFTFYYWGK